ncbi:hypothetical protein FXA47_03895 [Campylobacter jejuni]|nr:hypothetical protein [Campylobacter jejuni]
MAKNVVELHNKQLEKYSDSLNELVQKLGIPIDVFQNYNDRIIVIVNLENILSRIEKHKLQQANYISKFMASISVGLFDAALNYLWNETILNIRNKIIQYDISYFLEQSSLNENNKRQIKSDEDLSKLTDFDLLKGVKEIDLLSETGYKKLNYIREMRNEMSAAHPNNNALNAYDMLSHLQTCIDEVICSKESEIAIKVKKFLGNIKKNSLSELEIIEIGAFIENQSDKKINALALGLFGIYTDENTANFVIDNIDALYPYIWNNLKDEIKYKIGIKIAEYSANGDNNRSAKGKELLKNVDDGMSYLCKEHKIVELKKKLENLINAHNAYDNFYKEPYYAKKIENLVGKKFDIPKNIEYEYVLTITNVFLGNGCGISWEANEIYLFLMENFTENQIKLAIQSILEDEINRKLEFSKIAREQFLKMIGIFKKKLKNSNLIKICEDMEKSQNLYAFFGKDIDEESKKNILNTRFS